MASSLLYPGELHIDDSTPEHAHAVPEGYGTGLDYSGRSAEGYGTDAEPFPDALLIPRSEWRDRIAEMEQQKSRLSDIIVQAGLPPKDQERTLYCWINATTHALEVVRAVQNEPTVILSPASAGAQIKNYRNTGGWDRDALEWLSDKGACPVDIWPANAIDRRYCTPEAKQEALKYRVQRWWNLDCSSDEQLISCLLRRIPVAIGLDWWAHEVLACDAVWINNAIGLRPRNSWGDRPQYPNGFFTLQGWRARPSSAVAPFVAYAD